MMIRKWKNYIASIHKTVYIVVFLIFRGVSYINIWEHTLKHPSFLHFITTYIVSFCYLFIFVVINVGSPVTFLATLTVASLTY